MLLRWTDSICQDMATVSLSILLVVHSWRDYCSGQVQQENSCSFRKQYLLLSFFSPMPNSSTPSYLLSPTLPSTQPKVLSYGWKHLIPRSKACISVLDGCVGSIHSLAALYSTFTVWKATKQDKLPPPDSKPSEA